jgi:hypothetical protein
MSSARPKVPRAHPRFPASAVPSIAGVRLSAGDPARMMIANGMSVDLVNVSLSGMLVEGRTRLVPGSRVTIMIEGGFEPSQLRAKVVRCQVTAISEGALRYQCGLQFERPLDQIPTDADAPPVSAARPQEDEAAAPSSERILLNRW